jgi:hypothetical protein
MYGALYFSTEVVETLSLERVEKTEGAIRELEELPRTDATEPLGSLMERCNSRYQNYLTGASLIGLCMLIMVSLSIFL